MTDVFPRRNLPPESEEWGRTVEDAVYQAENLILGMGQLLSGLNRSSSATLENLALQIRQIQDLYLKLPITQQSKANAAGFSVPTAGAWNDILTLSIPFTEAGTLNLSATASGQLVKGSGSLLACNHRIVLSTGESSPEVPGSFAFSSGNSVNNFLVNYGWTLPVLAGSTVRVTLQSNPQDPWPGGTGSYAVMTAYGTFTRG